MFDVSISFFYSLKKIVQMNTEELLDSSADV